MDDSAYMILRKVHNNIIAQVHDDSLKKMLIPHFIFH